MVRAFRSSDSGKRVVTADGDEVGTVDQIKGDTAHVKPKGSLSQSIRQRLGWEEEMDTYELMHSNVQQISDDEIHLKE